MLCLAHISLTALLTVQIEFYSLDGVPLLLSGSVCVVLTAWVMQFFYRRDLNARGGEEEPQQGGGSGQDGAQDKAGATNVDAVVQNLNTFCIVGAIIGYPLLVIPIYLSPATTDWTRVVIVCG